jgi:hypothetical protein
LSLGLPYPFASIIATQVRLLAVNRSLAGQSTTRLATQQRLAAEARARSKRGLAPTGFQRPSLPLGLFFPLEIIHGTGLGAIPPAPSSWIITREPKGSCWAGARRAVPCLAVRPPCSAPGRSPPRPSLQPSFPDANSSAPSFPNAQAFVIYTFFTLLLLYLGGPRSLLTLLHSSLRPPTPHPFPLSLVLHPLDLSDPHSYLALKRGVLQYCVVKPILALVTVGLKLGEVYDEGQIGVGTGYTWVSVVYNASISVSL